jgi:hypothetical protein
MTEVVRIPDPVYEKLAEEAERMDMSRGAVVRMWMEAYYD